MELPIEFVEWAWENLEYVQFEETRWTTRFIIPPWSWKLDADTHLESSDTFKTLGWRDKVLNVYIPCPHLHPIELFNYPEVAEVILNTLINWWQTHHSGKD